MVFQFLITKGIRTDCSTTVSNGTIHKRNIVNIESDRHYSCRATRSREDMMGNGQHTPELSV